jgi:CHAD domain-containing protein
VLVRKLRSPHFHRLLKEWRQYLDGPLAADHPPGSKAALPIRQVAGARLWRMYQRVLKEGRAIDGASPASDLHELRKSSKKLRYLLEFFASLYPPQHIKPLIRHLKRLLDNLGEFQDLEVQAHQLRAFGEDLQGQDADNLPVVLAIGTLIGDLLRRQGAARAAFAGRFAAFDAAEQHAQCRALFHPAGGQA